MINYKLEIINFEKLIEYTNTCKLPKFPISGDDLKRYGKALADLEERRIPKPIIDILIGIKEKIKMQCIQ